MNFNNIAIIPARGGSKRIPKKNIKNFLDLQPGDVVDTYAEINDFIKDFGYKPITSIEKGMADFVSWFKKYYGY